MPRPRFEKLDPEKRERILEAAAKEFAAHGFEGASLNHILSNAGISKGAAYYYFDDKADLFATVLQNYWFKVLSEADFAIDRLDAEAFWPKVAELYDRAMAHAFDSPWLLPLFKSVWKLAEQPWVTERLAGPLGELGDWLRAVLVRGQEIGAVRADVPVDLLFAMFVAVDEVCDRWFLEHWDDLDRAEIEAVGLRMLDMARRMVEPPREGSP